MPIIIPDGVTVEIDKGVVKTKGPKGELVTNIPAGIKIELRIISLKF